MFKDLDKAVLVSVGTAIVTGIASPAIVGGGLEIENHVPASVVDLVPGAARGTITQPLLSGMILSTGAEVLFVITDASDKDFAEMFGTLHADALEEAPDGAVETAIFDGVDLIFFEDPGLVARFDVDDEVLPPVGNEN